MLFWGWSRTCWTLLKAERSIRQGMRKMFRALTLITALGLTAAAFGQVSSSSDAPEINESIIKTTTTNIVAPTIVTDRSGNLVDGLQPAQFHLFDNGKEQ